MNAIRLIPVVLVALGALLALKALGIATGDGYVTGGVTSAVAQNVDTAGEATPADEDGAAETAGEDPAGEPGAMEPAMTAEPGVMPADPLASANDLIAELSGEAEGMAAQETALAEQTPDALPTILNSQGESEPLVFSANTTNTEQTLLERLAERREVLVTWQNELDAREAVVAAAEKRLEIRFAQLQALETEINALVERQKEMDGEQFQALISMYENMKPKDAAAIFDRLNLDILVRVAKAMNPRKMSPILAGMSPDMAQTLTVQLASFESEPQFDPASGLPDDLPQIVGQ